jgi:hypothetical protein
LLSSLLQTLAFKTLGFGAKFKAQKKTTGFQKAPVNLQLMILTNLLILRLEETLLVSINLATGFVTALMRENGFLYPIYFLKTFKPLDKSRFC